MGYVDGPSQYGFAGNSPANRTDPLGLYEEDVHHYLTQYLAQRAGFSATDAAIIGFEAQELDMDDRDAMHGGVSHQNMERFHFVSALRLRELREGAFRSNLASPTARRAIGEYFHALEDSYSHQEDPVRRYFGKRFRDKALGVDIGHGLHGHEPDWTWVRVPLARRMAAEVYLAMIDLCQQINSTCHAAPMDQVLEEVDPFLSFKPDLFDDLKYGRVVPDVISYEKKIRKLDESYVVDPLEAAKRSKRYEDALRREENRKQEEQLRRERIYDQ